jgi:hypothetical protein
MEIHLRSVLGVAGLLLATGSLCAWADEPNKCSPRQFQTSGLVTYAEMREQRVANQSSNTVNPGMNGSIKVHGWQQSDVLIRACIITAAPTEDEAHDLTSQISIIKAPGEIEASGPSQGGTHKLERQL